MFNLQSRLIQTEGIIAQLAQSQFDAQMGVAYYNLGKSYNGSDQMRASLNFMTFLEHPSCKNLLQTWALSGLSDLIYGKAASNGAPLAWVLPEAELKDIIKTLMPYLASVPLKEHTNLVHQIIAQAQCDIPKQWVEALGNARANNQQSNLAGYLALLFLLDNALLAYDRPKYSRTNPQQITGYETCFITRSRNIVKAMAQANIFAVDRDMRKATLESQAAYAKFEAAIYGPQDKLLGVKTLSSLKQGTLAVAKLTPKTIDDGTCYYDLTIPQSGLDICNKSARILPVSLIYQFTEGFMSKLVENGYTRLSCVSPETGEYTVDVAVNPAVYKEAYAGSDPERVEARSRLPVGFALRSGTMHLLNLSSSVYSSKGYSRVNPWSITGVKKITLRDIDSIAHNYDPSAIKAVFIKHLAGKSVAELRVILSSIPELQAKYTEKTISTQGVVDTVPNVHYSALLKYLLQNVANVEEQLQYVGVRAPMRNYILKGNNDVERAEYLKELLKTHIVYISFIAKDGASEVYATNNEQILEEKLGAWYRLTFEGWDAKCEDLKKYVATYKMSSTSLVDAVVRKFKIKYLDVSKLKAVTPEALDEWINEARATKPKRNFTPDPATVLVRNLNASSPNEYFKNIKISSIQTIKIDD